MRIHTLVYTSMSSHMHRWSYCSGDSLRTSCFSYAVSCWPCPLVSLTPPTPLGEGPGEKGTVMYPRAKLHRVLPSAVPPPLGPHLFFHGPQRERVSIRWVDYKQPTANCVKPFTYHHWLPLSLTPQSLHVTPLPSHVMPHIQITQTSSLDHCVLGALAVHYRNSVIPYIMSCDCHMTVM